MYAIKEEQCRLCHSTINDRPFKEIKNVTKSILDVLLLNLNLDDNRKHIVCDICFQRVMQAFKFKSMCVYTDNTIISYVDDETGCCIPLKEIYMKETGDEHSISTLGDYEVCRLCLQLIKDKLIAVHKMERDMIQIYIPEINLTVIEDAVLCKQCFDSFVSHSNYIMNCLEANKKIKSFCKEEAVDDSICMPAVDSYIKTEEVDIKSENEQEELLETDSTVTTSVYEDMLNKASPREIKAEDEEERSNRFRKSNKSTTDLPGTLSHNRDARDVGVLRSSKSESSCKQNYSPKRDPLKLKYISEVDRVCNALDSNAKQKGNLKKHHLRRKDIFECHKCDYKTKRKGNLKTHQLIHKDISETKVFECHKCDYKTKRKGTLTTHQLMHKDISETEVFECYKCDYKTKLKGSLKRHHLIHKDISETKVFECHKCDYKTKRKSDLKRHQLIHKDISETKVFECHKCDYKTKRKGSLKRHQLIHKDISETKVFECHKCDYKTKRKSDLKRHQLIHKDISETKVFECHTM